MRRLAAAIAVSGLFWTAGCGGGTPTANPPTTGGTSAGATSASTSGSTPTTASASPTNYLDAGRHTLTPPGTVLRYGQAAVVAWQPGAGRTAVAKLAVKSVEKAPLSILRQWKLPKNLQDASLYFAHVRVKNLGRLDLAKQALPVYAAVDQSTLVQASTFAGTFSPCPSGTVGKHLRKGDAQRLCLLYLLPGHGHLQSIAFRPMADVAPLWWTGDVTKWKPAGKKRR